MNEILTRALLARVVAGAPTAAPVDLDRVIALAEAEHRSRTRWVIAAAAILGLLVTIAVTIVTLGHGADRAAPALRPVYAPR